MSKFSVGLLFLEQVEDIGRILGRSLGSLMEEEVL